MNLKEVNNCQFKVRRRYNEVVMCMFRLPKSSLLIILIFKGKICWKNLAFIIKRSYSALIFPSTKWLNIKEFICGSQIRINKLVPYLPFMIVCILSRPRLFE
jgi:hypothetical protein